MTESIIKALEKDWKRIWLESNSESVIHDFQSKKIQWTLMKKWSDFERKIDNLILSTNKREANFATDCCANKHVLLVENQTIWYEGMSPFESKLKNSSYRPFGMN